MDSDDSIFQDLLKMIAEEKQADLIERLLRFWQLAHGGHTDLRAPWAKAFRKSVLDQHSVRFARGLRIGEDALFNIAFYLVARSCKYIPAPGYLHRVRMSSISHSWVPDLSESFSILQRGMRDLLEAHGMFPLLTGICRQHAGEYGLPSD